MKNLQRAGITPHSLTSDVGPEWTGEFARMLDSKGIVSFQKRPEDKNAIATLDVAIGQLKNSLYATHEDLAQTIGHRGFKKSLMGKTKTLLKII